MPLYRASIEKGFGATRSPDRCVQSKKRSIMCFPNVGSGATRILGRSPWTSDVHMRLPCPNLRGNPDLKARPSDGRHPPIETFCDPWIGATRTLYQGSTRWMANVQPPSSKGIMGQPVEPEDEEWLDIKPLDSLSGTRSDPDKPNWRAGWTYTPDGDLPRKGRGATLYLLSGENRKAPYARWISMSMGAGQPNP
jgi:hypothetical protein